MKEGQHDECPAGRGQWDDQESERLAKRCFRAAAANGGEDFRRQADNWMDSFRKTWMPHQEETLSVAENG